jgi:RNA-dependent RNA polymerase
MGSIVKPPAEWQRRSELSIIVKGLQPTATTLSLALAFDREGTVVYVGIDEDRGIRNGSAKIRFSPPPKTDFWARDHGRYLLTDDKGSGYFVQIRAERMTSHDQQFQSPVRKHIFYPALIKLAPEQLVFGIMEDERTIMACQRIQGSRKDRISFEVDLRRRRLKVLFNVSFIDPRLQGVEDFQTDVQLGQNDRVNTYMFQIPFENLKSIKYLDYEQRGIQDFFGLVICLDSPPPYYRKQIGAQAGHVPGNLVWSEFDTWYRQTDIDYDPYRLNTVKVSLHKEHPEIDTGE